MATTFSMVPSSSRWYPPARFQAMGIGGTMVAGGLGGSAIILADDVTVIGVVDDPFLIVTGGVVVAGGVIVGVGGVIDWLGW